jgi:hypothetical protein
VVGYDVDGQAVSDTFYPVSGTRLYGVSVQGGFGFFVSDSNTVAYNPVAAGSTVAVTATDGLSVIVSAGSPVPSTLTPSGLALNYKFDDKTFSGTVTVKVSSPGGMTSAHTVFLSQGAKPDSYVTCVP